MAIPLSYNLRNLRVRLTTTVMTALGVALTVAVLLGILAMVNGLQGALAVTGNPRQVLVLRQGATAELVSVVTEEQFRTLRLLDGIEQRDGEPMASHEVVSVVSLRLRSDPNNSETEGNVNIRGVSPMGRYLRDDLRLVEGRWFETGRREVIVGSGVHGIRAGTDIGDKIALAAATGKSSASLTTAAPRTTPRFGATATWPRSASAGTARAALRSSAPSMPPAPTRSSRG
ncbi:MAG: ABC transporter permease [Bryobacterales bacterium]